MASSWILFFSYQDDARSNTHQTNVAFLKLRHPRFICNNEVKDNVGQKTTSLLAGCSYGESRQEYSRPNARTHVPRLTCSGDCSHHTFSTLLCTDFSHIYFVRRLRWSRGSVLAFSTQVRGFKPDRSRRIFRAKKSSARLPSEVK